MRRGPEVSGWAGSLFPEPIEQAKPILLDDNSKVLTVLRNERGELYCNCYGMIVKERKCHKCVGYVLESDTCRWAMSVHDAELVNGKPQWAETKPAPEPPWSGKPVDTFAGAAFRQPAPKLESNQDESLDFSKEWYYCASANAIRNHLPCDECIRSEPREEIHCIRFFKLHPCAYFNSAHCNGSTCEYWDPKTIACTYGPYLAWLAVPSAPAVEPTKLTEWVLSNCGKHHTCRDDCAGRKGGLCPFTVSREGGIPADLLDDSAKDDAETKAAKKLAKPAFHRGDRVKFRDDLAPGGIGFGYVTGISHGCDRDFSVHVTWAEYGKAVAMSKDRSCQLMSPDQLELAPESESSKPAKVKKSRCPDISTDCPERKECALNKFWKWRPCAVSTVKPAKESIAVFLNGKWYSDGKMLWDCSDCLCQVCANRGKSCHDCKGYEHCLKHGGKIGNCPDFRTEEGKEQHCLENGCLCFKCQLIGEQCELCAGPIECEGPTTACHDYVGADTDDVEEETT